MRKQLILATALLMSVSPAMASFATMDDNGDDKISKDEYYGSITDAGTYSDWDLNSDGLIDEDEFGELGYDWDYDTWDADTNGYVDSGEFYDGYYATYDANEDGHWQNGEWDDAGEAGLFDW